MRIANLTLLLVAVALVAGCGKRPTVDQTYREGESPLGEPEHSYGADVSLSSPDEADLAKAKALVRAQDFAGATRLLEPLTHDADRAVREEALWELGELQGHLLNPDKDYPRAIATLNTLLVEYPQSRFRARAEEAIVRFQTFQDPEPAP